MITPDQLYGQLFIDVQLRKIFPDNKIFVDCIPKRKPKDIVADYNKLKSENLSDADILKFVESNFTVPVINVPDFKQDRKNDIVEHIEELWNVLKRSADKVVEGSSLIALPFPYIVPGGRFQEIYYWDSYFTMLGLAESQKWDIIENMIENFSYLIEQYGYIPNGNRTYFLNRSQPPYFSLMIELLASHKNNAVYAIYQSSLQKEYDYWMDETADTHHEIKMPDGSTLNRYYDQNDTPRPESYFQDDELSKDYKGDITLLYRDVRSCAESGWDFSGRWFKDGKTFSTIQTTNLIPVDLNCLLYHLELSLAISYRQTNSIMQADVFSKKAAQRKDAINKYFYNDDNGWYYDYNISEKKLNEQKTIAGITPFFFCIPPATYIARAATIVKKDFFKYGGVVTTLINTGQQWDAPNGWAPLQWITIKSLENYHQTELAKDIANKWAQLNIKIYQDTGKLMEKYNVIDTDVTAGGGEYPSQDGFGWTNGVLLKILKTYSE